MKSLKITFLLSLLVVCFSVAVYAQKAEPLEIKFAKGKTSKTVSETLSGDQQMEYVFNTRAGQKVSIKFVSKTPKNTFDFTLNGESFDFQTDNESYIEYDFTAPETGNYLLYVRKKPSNSNKPAKFYLNLSIK